MERFSVIIIAACSHIRRQFRRKVIKNVWWKTIVIYVAAGGSFPPRTIEASEEYPVWKMPIGCVCALVMQRPRLFIIMALLLHTNYVLVLMLGGELCMRRAHLYYRISIAKLTSSRYNATCSVLWRCLALACMSLEVQL